MWLTAVKKRRTVVISKIPGEVAALTCASAGARRSKKFMTNILTSASISRDVRKERRM